MAEIVVISGGAGVLGRAYAKYLADDGYRPILLDIKQPDVPELSGEFIRCDITREEDVEALAKHLESLDATVYGLINNASAQPPGFTEELDNYSLSTYRDVLDVNLVGSFLLTRMAVRFMKEQQRGSIINIASIQGVVAPTFDLYSGTTITSPLSYGVAKAAMIHFCKWVAAKYGPDGIRCNSISPGGVGDHHKGGGNFPDNYAARTPLRRMARSSDVSEAVRFLISERSSYITGQNLVVDGGWSIY